MSECRYLFREDGMLRCHRLDGLCRYFPTFDCCYIYQDGRAEAAEGAVRKLVEAMHGAISVLTEGACVRSATTRSYWVGSITTVVDQLKQARTAAAALGLTETKTETGGANG